MRARPIDSYRVTAKYYDGAYAAKQDLVHEETSTYPRRKIDLAFGCWQTCLRQTQRWPEYSKAVE